MTLGSNIRYLRKKHNYSQDKLAEILGYKSFTTIQKWESGVAEPPFKTLAKLAEIFHVDIDDLAKKDLSSDDTPNPVFEAAAGEGRLNDGYPTEEYRIQLEPEEFVVRVVGRSMEPTLQDGDIVIVTAQSLIDYPRQIALVKINGEEATIKRVEVRTDGVMLTGDNMAVYPPHFFTPDQVEQLPVKIEGVVTKLIRDLR